MKWFLVGASMLGATSEDFAIFSSFVCHKGLGLRILESSGPTVHKDQVVLL
jgi:hypothetical protein